MPPPSLKPYGLGGVIAVGVRFLDKERGNAPRYVFMERMTCSVQQATQEPTFWRHGHKFTEFITRTPDGEVGWHLMPVGSECGIVLFDFVTHEALCANNAFNLGKFHLIDGVTKSDRIRDVVDLIDLDMIGDIYRRPINNINAEWELFNPSGFVSWIYGAPPGEADYFWELSLKDSVFKIDRVDHDKPCFQAAIEWMKAHSWDVDYTQIVEDAKEEIELQQQRDERRERADKERAAKAEGN